MKICLFARYPRLGQVKSRLAKDCGEEGALLLYQKILENIFRQLNPLKEKVKVFYTGCTASEANQWLMDYEHAAQCEGDLGERLKYVLTTEKFEKLIFIGVDCLDITEKILSEAEQMLDSSDVVLGPASYGGYYLIGLNKPQKELFNDIDWGTARVFEQTMNIIYNNNLSYSLLPEKNDLDYMKDIPHEWKLELDLLNDCEA